jgi:hypothetical protein
MGGQFCVITANVAFGGTGEGNHKKGFYMKNCFKARIAPLLGVVALAAVIGFSVTGCPADDDGGGGGGGSGGAKKITITGITGSYDMAMVLLMTEDGGGAGGMGAISGGSVTVDLQNEDDTAFTGSGSFYVMLIIGNSNDDTDGAMYVYTNSAADVDLSTEEKAMQNMKEVSITSAVTTLAFNLFQTAPAWMEE